MNELSKTMLVTGSNGGLGKYCLSHFNAHGFTRESSIEILKTLAEQQAYEAIIHTAYNTKQNINDTNLASYLNDTLFLMQQLLDIPHKKFIFISTVDIYPKNEALHNEDEIVAVKDVESIYGLSKLMCESYLKSNSQNYLILRPTALLGPYAKKNSLMRLLTEANVQLTLAPTSTFNYVLHQDICDFIEVGLRDNLTGIYNIAATRNISLAEVMEVFKPQANIIFGNYTYQVGNICNQKLSRILPQLNRSSIENIKLFYQNMEYVSTL